MTAPAGLRSLIQKHVNGVEGLGPMVMGRGWTFRVPMAEVNSTVRVLEDYIPAGVDVYAQRDGRILVCDHRAVS